MSAFGALRATRGRKCRGGVFRFFDLSDSVLLFGASSLPVGSTPINPASHGTTSQQLGAARTGAWPTTETSIRRIVRQMSSARPLGPSATKRLTGRHVLRLRYGCGVPSGPETYDVNSYSYSYTAAAQYLAVSLSSTARVHPKACKLSSLSTNSMTNSVSDCRGWPACEDNPHLSPAQRTTFPCQAERR